MPVVAIVAGVIIRLYYDDHDPLHFHAIFGSDEMIIPLCKRHGIIAVSAKSPESNDAHAPD